MERPNPSVVCKDCNYVGYLSYEKYNNNNEDYDVDFCCPLCGKISLLDISASNSALYCVNCKTIVSQSWCVHGHNGCTQDVHYGLWFEIDNLIPTFSTVEDANKFFIKYKAKELKNTIIKLVCGCYGNCCERKYQCPKAYNTNNSFNDYITECCTLYQSNTRPIWFNHKE